MNISKTILVADDRTHPAFKALDVMETLLQTASTNDVIFDKPAFEEWTSVVLVVDSSQTGSILHVDADAWYREIETRLGQVLISVQKVSSMMRKHRGRILVAWEEGGPAANAQSVMSGGLVSLIKASCLDLSPLHIGINGLIVPRSGQGREIATLGSCLSFMASRRAEGMVGQVVLPGSVTSGSSWGTW